MMQSQPQQGQLQAQTTQTAAQPQPQPQQAPPSQPTPTQPRLAEVLSAQRGPLLAEISSLNAQIADQNSKLAATKHVFFVVSFFNDFFDFQSKTFKID